MNRRLLPSFGAALAVLALVALAPAAEAQTEADPPRLPWGAPDLQGVWDFHDHAAPTARGSGGRGS